MFRDLQIRNSPIRDYFVNKLCSQGYYVSNVATRRDLKSKRAIIQKISGICFARLSYDCNTR